MLKLYSLFLLTSILVGSELNTESTEKSLTVYNNNVGLVHEKHLIKIKKTDTTLVYKDIASTIQTNSVNIKLPNNIKVYSQQYRFDKLTKQKLIQAYINKEILSKKIKGKLLSCNGDSCLIKTQKNQIISIKSDSIIFNKIPKQLVTKPYLIWNIKSNKTIDTNIEIDYLIQNISFKSDYILNIDGKKADLTGWITIDNHSGKSFKNTKLFVLAGDVNRIQNERNLYLTHTMVNIMSNDSMKIEHENYEGYHFYKIPFKINISNNEKTQIKFIDKINIDIKRKYTSTMSNPKFFNSSKIHNVTQYITIDKINKPLPKGIIHTYSILDNNTIFLGESRIKHTPKNILLDVKLGNNFDLKVKESVLKRFDDKKYFNTDIMYEIKNNSPKDKMVQLLVPFNKSKYSNIKTHQKYKFTNGNFVTFSIFVKSNSLEKIKVNYRSKK